MPFEVVGSVAPEEVPPSTEPPRKRAGEWTDLTDRIVNDRLAGRVTVMKLTTANEKELMREIDRMRNGMRVPMRQAGLSLQAVIVKTSPSEARIFLEAKPFTAPKNGTE